MYCDFMKAFDTVLHGRLVQVLNNYGVDDYLGDMDKELSYRQKAESYG